MAFGRLTRQPAPKPMSDINMTPLIDVMLVLLVIFIITAPLMASSLRLNLPKAQGAAPSDSATVLAISVDPTGQLYLQDQKVDAAHLTEQARAAAQRSPDTEVQLRADQSVPYGRVAELIGLLQDAGLSRIGFVTSGAPADQPAGP